MTLLQRMNLMFKYVNAYDRQFKRSELILPTVKQRMMFLKAKEMIGFDRSIKVKFYIKEGSHIDLGFSGIACKLSNHSNQVSINTPYAVVIASGIYRESKSYIMYVLAHELKHCTGLNGRFRRHDHYLMDIGWEARGRENIRIGFFSEEWKRIGCCDDLMSMFVNLDGIDEYI